MTACYTCHGSGSKYGGGVCHTCGGSGKYEGCFPANAMVLTPNGPRKIESLMVNSKVMSIEKGGHLVANKILKKVAYSARSVSRITFEDGTFLDVTKSHCMKSDKGWILVKNLVQGSGLIFSENGFLQSKTIQKIELNVRIEPVFNIVVDKDCNFIVDGYVANSFSYFRVLRTLAVQLKSRIYNKPMFGLSIAR